MFNDTNYSLTVQNILQHKIIITKHVNTGTHQDLDRERKNKPQQYGKKVRENREVK